MAINPLQIPGYAAPQSYDFSSLAQLPQVYRQAQARQSLAGLARGPDGTIDTAPLYASGDLSLANLAAQIDRNKVIDSRDARDFAFRQQESQRAQSNADRTFGQTQSYQNRSLDIQEENAKRKDIPTGFEANPAGGVRPISGGPADPNYLRTKPDTRQSAPSGYIWNDPTDPSKGMRAIPGGPGEKVDAEVAGRLGLAKHFLGQLPQIREAVAKGDATGGFDAAKAWAGVGKPGQIRRQMDSGAEALLRMLTGAGMNKEEAGEYTRRYKLSPTDTSATVLDKLTQLEGELNSVGETVGRGRGGSRRWRPSSRA